MSACADESSTIYYCVICGPCLRDLLPNGSTKTVHRNIPHPPGMTYDEEERPQ
jgi:hypothetical protein